MILKRLEIVVQHTEYVKFNIITNLQMLTLTLNMLNLTFPDVKIKMTPC